LNQSSLRGLRAASGGRPARRPRGRENGWEVASGGARWATRWAHAVSGKGRLNFLHSRFPQGKQQPEVKREHLHQDAAILRAQRILLDPLNQRFAFLAAEPDFSRTLHRVLLSGPDMKSHR
jgi:hypothetical protein